MCFIQSHCTTPVYDPVALPRRGVEILEPTVEKTDKLGLVPGFQTKWKSVIFIFSFDFYTDTILKQWNILKNKYFCVFFHFSLFSLVSRFLFPLCFPLISLMVPCVWFRCTTPLWGRSPWANRWKSDEIGLVSVFKKNQKIRDFQFFLRFLYKHYFKAMKYIEKYIYLFVVFFTFHFSLLFPVLFPRCACLLWSPVYDPVALPRRGVEVLEPTVEKTDELGLVSVFKKNKKSVIFIFSFDLCTGTFLKQWNILKNKYFCVFFHFSCFSPVSVFFPSCASLSWFLVYDPVALPRRGVEVLEPTVEKTDELGLVPVFKKNQKNGDFQIVPSICVQALF